MQAPPVQGMQFLSQPQTNLRYQSPVLQNTVKRRLSDVIDSMNVPPSPSSGKFISEFTREESEKLERNLLLHGFHFQNGDQADQQRKNKMNDYLPDDQAKERNTQYE